MTRVLFILSQINDEASSSGIRDIVEGGAKLLILISAWIISRWYLKKLRNNKKDKS